MPRNLALSASKSRVVRKTIIRGQLTDPRFYEQMSKPLDDLIQQSRADTAAYEEFLRKAEALVRRLAERRPKFKPLNVRVRLANKPENSPFGLKSTFQIASTGRRKVPSRARSVAMVVRGQSYPLAP